MMIKLNYFFALLLLIGLTSCNNSKQNNTEESKQITEAQVKLNQAEETMAIATSFMQAMNTGDMQTMTSLMDEDMVWHNEGDASLPWIGPWKGKKAILEEFLPTFMEHFATTKWETEDAISQGDVAAFFGKMEGKNNITGQLTGEFTFALRVKVNNGKIVLWNWFEDSYAVSNTFNNNLNK